MRTQLSLTFPQSDGEKKKDEDNAKSLKLLDLMFGNKKAFNRHKHIKWIKNKETKSTKFDL